MSHGRGLSACRRLLLIEANDQKRWIGSRVEPQMHIPPLGLMALGAYVKRERPEVQVKLVETSLEPDLRAVLDSFQPDIVGLRGINVFTPEYTQAAEAVKAWGDVPVLGGGPVATSMKGELLRRCEAFDVLVKGEGEATLVHLLSGAAWDEVPGLVYRHGKNLVETPDRALIDPLDSLPTPDYALVDLDRYAAHLSYTYNHRRQGVLSTSRGCPFRCTYCLTFGGKTARLQSAARVFEDMERLSVEHGVEDFYFIDDVFNLSKPRAREIFRRLIAAPRTRRLYFVNGLRADVMDRELVDLMAAAGAVWVTYAVETANPGLQKLTKRVMNLERALETINYTQAKDVVVNVNTMFGFPTETPEMAQETLDFLARLSRPSTLPYHFCLRGYDGCEIVEQAEAAGWDRDAFLGDNGLAYNAVPRGTPTFPREAMMLHLIEYHERFGLRNRAHLKDSVALLARNGYTDRDVADMYTVLQNRPIRSPAEVYRA